MGVFADCTDRSMPVVDLPAAIGAARSLEIPRLLVHVGEVDADRACRRLDALAAAVSLGLEMRT